MSSIFELSCCLDTFIEIMCGISRCHPGIMTYHWSLELIIALREITSIDDLATRQRLIWRDIMYDQLARARMMTSETGIDIKDKRVLPNENVALDSLFSLITSSLSLDGSRVSRPF